MAFQKTTGYFEWKIQAIKNGITKTKESLKKFQTENNTRAIEAHESQIASYEKNLKQVLIDFENFKSEK